MNKRKSKRLISILLACLMVVSIFPAAAFADDGDTNNGTVIEGGTGTEKDPGNEPGNGNDNAAEDPVVAKIGDTNYTSLAEAFKAAKDGDTVTLTAAAAEQSMTIPKGTAKIIVTAEEGVTFTKAIRINASDIKITGIHFELSPERVNVGQNVIVSGAQNVTIEGNAFVIDSGAPSKDWQPSSVWLEGGATGTRIAGNQFALGQVYNNDAVGINLAGNSANPIKDTVIDGNIVNAESIHDNGKSGNMMFVVGNDNKVTADSYGINGLTISNNKIYNKTGKEPVKSKIYGVSVSTTTGTKVTGNYFEGYIAVGYSAWPGQNPNTDMTVTDNTFNSYVGLTMGAKYVTEGGMIFSGNKAGENVMFMVNGSSTSVADPDGKTYSSIDKAVEAGVTNITLLKNITLDTPITLPANVTLDGNNYTLSYMSDTLTNGAFITAEKDQDNVTIKNLTINAENIKHGVQFYCNEGGKLDNVTVNGGTYTSVIVNGAEAALTECTLNPDETAYTNIEYAMGSNVTTAPNITLDKVMGRTEKPLVYADKATADKIKTGDETYAAVAEKINGNLNGAEVTLIIDKDTIIPGTQIRTITLDANGGNAVTPSTILTKNDGTLSQALPTPTYGGGYKFLYWAKNDGTKVDANTIFTEDTTLKAVWEPPYTGKYSYEITTKVGDNGSIKVDRYATEDEKVTITVNPDEAYLLDELTATSGKKEIELKDNGDGTYTFTMPHGDVTITATFAEDPDWVEPTPEPEMPFTDVNDGDWFYDVVKYAYNEGLMTGTSDTTFEPNIATTRGMIVSMLARLEGNPTAKSAGFADVADGAWYADAVNWAASEGIVSGYSDTEFGPNDPITREQMAAILYNYAEYKGMDVSARADLDKYTDAASISSWATDVLSWANAEGLVNGMTETTLVPQGQATRAQVAAIFERFLTK